MKLLFHEENAHVGSIAGWDVYTSSMIQWSRVGVAYVTSDVNIKRSWLPSPVKVAFVAETRGEAVRVGLAQIDGFRAMLASALESHEATEETRRAEAARKWIGDGSPQNAGDEGGDLPPLRPLPGKV